MSKKTFASLIALFAIISSCFSQNHEYKVVKTYHIASAGRLGLYSCE